MVSNASADARYLDDLEAPVNILRRCTSLRTLWASRPVVVRVHSSALGRFWRLLEAVGRIPITLVKRWTPQSGGRFVAPGRPPRQAPE